MMAVVEVLVFMMVVTVILLMSDDSKGPRIGQSFIIFTFSVIKKMRDRPTNQWTDLPMDGQTLL